MKRQMNKTLLQWLNSEKKAILVTGARQTGKTYIIRQFGQENFQSFIEINFLENKEARNLFTNATSANDILLYISAIAKCELIPNKTLIFFDEIQECPEIVTAVKFLAEEGSYKYVLSGSLLGVEMKNIKSMPVGYCDIVQMYPMNFMEFCEANGVSDNVIQYLLQCFENRQEVSPAIHEKMIKLFFLYVIIGGMPEVVKKFIETNNIQEIVAVQNSISEMYKKDIAKYDPKNKLFLQDIYDLIPSELNNQSKRFVVNNLKNGIKFDRLENSFLWLTDAGVALPVYCANEPKFPLILSRARNLMKLFLCDIGLLASMYSDNLQVRILAEELDINFGGIFENAVAQELCCNNVKSYYYKNNRIGELDFLIEIDGKIIPLEVKSGKNYTKHSAINNLLNNPNFNIPFGYVLSKSNIKTDGNKIYLPIYMTMFIRNSEIPNIIVKPYIPVL